YTTSSALASAGFFISAGSCGGSDKRAKRLPLSLLTLQFRCYAQPRGREPSRAARRIGKGPRPGRGRTGEGRPRKRTTLAHPSPLQGRGKREPHVLAQYLPTLLFLIVATGIGVALIIVGRVLGPRSPDPRKLSPYECGFEAFEDARMKFDVRYYLIAIQFIVFDLEIIFIVPWTLVFQDLGPRALVTMGLFVGMLFLGFVYVWKKGALEWE